MPATGNATPGQIVKGSDTRLSDARALLLAGAGTGQVPVWNGSAWVVGTVGLTNFAESLSSSSPNSTVRVSALTTNVSTTDGDIVISPKGAGSILVQVPDGSSTGGNKRGQYSVDLQRSRSANTQVASGSYSFIGGGQGNSAVSQGSAVSGGEYNSCQGFFSAIYGGHNNITSSTEAFVGGGFANTASGSASVVVGGSRNEASGYASAIVGGTWAYARGITGAKAWGGGASITDQVLGKRQVVDYLLSCSTTNTTSTRMTTDGNSTASSTNIMVMPNNSIYYFSYMLIGRITSNNSTWCTRGQGAVSRGATAASTTLLFESRNNDVSNFTPNGVSFASDTTLGCLSILVQGVPATAIDWVCHIECLELTA